MVDILAIQNKFIAAGYSFQETIYNDGHWRGNCSIKFSIVKDCHNFSEGHNLLGDFGWGRFDREHAWLQADEWYNKNIAK